MLNIRLKPLVICCLLLLMPILAVGSDATVAFVDIPSGLPGVFKCSVAWADYDNDGDLDLALSGSTSTGYKTRIYRNEGGTFTDVAAPLIDVGLSSLAWGDYDRDSDLDLIVTGYNGTATARLYRNDNGTFADSGVALPAVYSGSVSWGDFDNDGDADLGICGSTGSSSVSKVVRNDNGKFADIGVALPGVTTSCLAWADYDNDGDLDLSIAGYDGSACVSKIFRNDGNGKFTDISAAIVGVKSCSLAWGDYDNDGDLDLAIAGNTGSTLTSRIYRNDRTGKFTDSAVANIFGASNCSLAWGDADNDGDSDLALAAWTSSGRVTTVYRNDGGTFVNNAPGFQALSDAAIAWGDCDNDSDLDLLLAGGAGGGIIATHVYANQSAAANSPPYPPAGLSSSIAAGTVMLSWMGASDAQTPTNGLSYNIRIGSIAGCDDVVKGLSDLATGLRRISALGNAQSNLSWSVGGLVPGTYYWSVQAIDTAFAGSTWATERSFVIPGVSISGYVKDSTGNPLSGALVTPSSGGVPVTTDSGGYYNLRVVAGWSGTVSVTKGTYSFAPSSYAYSNIAASSSQDYTAYPYPCICGTVKMPDGVGVQDVTVNADSGGWTAKTDALGRYQLQVPPGWTGAVTPSKTYFKMTPASLQYTTAVTADISAQDYVATAYPKISGRVRTPGGVGVSGVSIAAGTGDAATTDDRGYYEVSVPPQWSGTTNVAKSLFVINPAGRNYNGVSANQVDQDYTATAYPRIAGVVTAANGVAIERATVTASNGGPTVRTDSTGRYEIAVIPGWSGAVTPALGTFTFSPSSIAYSSLLANVSNQSFTVNRYYPAVTPAQARRLNDLSVVTTKGTISAVFADCYYIETPGAAAGIRVEASEYKLKAGTPVVVSGVMRTNTASERLIVADSLSAE